MRILFICSGNKTTGISPIVEFQAESLKRLGVKVDIFPIVGKGIDGYIKNVGLLRKHLINNQYNILHPHYGFSGILAFFSRKNEKIVVSLMGSDLLGNSLMKIIYMLMAKFAWDATIVKSQEMYKSLNQIKAQIIPNGVDLETFTQIEKHEARKRLGWENKKKHILFGSDPKRKEKNYPLAEEIVFSSTTKEEVILHPLKRINKEELYLYYSAADLLLITSIREGSPNVVKEAMACNCPIVSTNVGDVKWLLGELKGHYIIPFSKDLGVNALKEAMDFSSQNRTSGRDRIIELGLDSKSIAQRIKKTYEKLNNEIIG